jgi:hypothetical protein
MTAVTTARNHQRVRGTGHTASSDVYRSEPTLVQARESPLADRESGAPGRPRYVVHRAHDAGMAYLRRVHSVKSLAARRGCRKGSQNVTRRTFPRQVTGPFVQHLFNYGFSGRASALIPPPAVYESVPRLLSTLSTRLVADNRLHVDTQTCHSRPWVRYDDLMTTWLRSRPSAAQPDIHCCLTAPLVGWAPCDCTPASQATAPIPTAIRVIPPRRTRDVLPVAASALLSGTGSSGPADAISKDGYRDHQ